MVGVDVGRRIRQARLERGLSLAQLGGEDLSRSFLSLVELGRSRISLRALTIVAQRLGLPLSYFLDDAPGVSEGAAELALDRAEAALTQQDPAACLRLLDETPESDLSRLRVLWLRASALIDLGQPREAIPVIQEGLELAERRDDPYMALELRYKLGLALYSTDNYDEASIHLRHVVDESESEFADPLLVGKAVVCLGHVAYVHNDVDSAIEHYSRARELFGSLADLNAMACVYSGMSAAYERKGDLRNALRYSKLSLGAFTAQHNGRQVARELNNLACEYRDLGDLDRALECAREAVTRAQEIKSREVEAVAHSTMASVFLRRDDIATAETEARLADELSSSDTDLARIDAWVVLAKIADRKGDRARTDALYRRALENLRQIGHHSAYADAALAYSLMLRQRGDTEGALDYALQAAEARPARPV
jgi:tetratricopeptide (TPR) repeat protein